jgi:transposase InsO family protein
MVTPAARREAVAHLEQGYEMSERRACSVIGADRSSVRYRHRRPDDRELREVLRGAAETHRRFGYRRLHVILRRDGHVLNHKRTQRLYREEGLSVRRRRSRKRAIGTRAPLVTEALANARWSVDFVQDQFADGRRFRILNVIDDVTKESLAAVVDTSISGRRVARELTALIERRGKPGVIVSDNVLAREQIAVLGVRSHGIRATGYLRNSYPGGLRRQEVVSSIANTGSAWLPPSPSLRRDPKSQAEGPNIIYEVASCASTAL